MPERWGMDVFDTLGNLQARLGDISGRPWGGAGFTLPEGTFGMWTARRGAWLKDNVTMFYFSHREHTDTRTINETNTGGGWSVDHTVDLVFPFGSLVIPSGRAITLEHFPRKLAQTCVHSVLGTVGADSVRLKKFSLRASLNAAGVAGYDLLYGPASGTHTWSSVAARLVISGGYGVTGGGTATSVTSTFIVGLRMFAHEIHAIPTVSSVSATTTAGGTASGEAAVGEGIDPSVSGTETGVPGGEAGGGGCVPAGTLVRTRGGILVPVESLDHGVEVPALGDRLTLSRLRVVEVYHDMPVFLVNGTLKATGDQRVRTRRGWVTVDELMTGDELMTERLDWEPFASRESMPGLHTVYNPRFEPVDAYFGGGYVLDDIKV